MRVPFLCLLFAWTITATLYEGFKNGYPLHSGVDIVIDDERYPSASLQVPHLSNLPIKDTQIFNILAQVFGTPQLSNNDVRITVDSLNLFSRPKGNMFFVLEGLTDGMLKDSSFKVLRSVQPTPIRRTSRPYHPEATLATVVTGQSPNHHHVYQAGEQLARMNIFDLASRLYDNSAVVGASLTKSTSEILSPATNGLQYHWCDKSSEWKGAFTKLAAVDKSLVQQLDQSLFNQHKEEKSIQALLNEVSFVLNAGKVLPQQQYTSFFFSFHFQSLRLISEKFGADSEQFKQAVELIDAAIEIASKDSSLQVLYLPAVINSEIESLNKVLMPIVGEYLDASSSFPYLHLNQKGLAKKQELCQELRTALIAASFDKTNVFCALRERETTKRAEFSLLETPSNNGTDTEVALFHTFFWVFPALIAGLLFAIYGLAYGIEPDMSTEESANYVKPGVHQKWQ